LPRRLPLLNKRFMEALIDELKIKIISTLSLEDVQPADIKTDEPIFGMGLGLDSIDSLELVSMLERDYGILIEEMSVAQKAFASVRTLAEFVAKNRKN
jgi:acyl carrier protein